MFNKDSSITIFYRAGFVLTSVGQSGLCGEGGQSDIPLKIIKKKKKTWMFETFQLNLLFLYNSLTDVDSSMYNRR